MGSSKFARSLCIEFNTFPFDGSVSNRNKFQIQLKTAIQSFGFIGYIGFIGCMGFIGCIGRIGFIGGIGSIGCIGFIGWIGLIVCIGLIGCIGFIGGIGCIGFIGCIGRIGYIYVYIHIERQSVREREPVRVRENVRERVTKRERDNIREREAVRESATVRDSEDCVQSLKCMCLCAVWWECNCIELLPNAHHRDTTQWVWNPTLLYKVEPRASRRWEVREVGSETLRHKKGLARAHERRTKQAQQCNAPQVLSNTATLQGGWVGDFDGMCCHLQTIGSSYKHWLAA